MTDRPLPRLRVGRGAVIVLLLVGLGVAVLVSALGGRDGSVPVVAPSPFTQVQSGSIYVHVLGAVPEPGLHELRPGDRVVDAIAAAGGFTDDADQTQLNLARLLVDGEQLYVPVVGEVPVSTGSTSGGKVNLNTADQAALEALPEVGPALAQAILSWREKNGRFTVVEDLLSVSGIGEKTFETLKDLVTV